MQNLLSSYVESNGLSRKSTSKNGVNYDLYCYTKEAFFAREWDEILISHRGKIYNADTGHVVNNPIPKIFNLNEHETSSFENLERLLASEPYEILDKVNGHLVIVSPDASTQFKNILVSTKGSFEEMAKKDEDLLHLMGVIRFIKHLSLNYTMMFECLAEYDKHLWYEEQKARYGGDDTMVLLAAVDNNTGEELNYDQLRQLSWMIAAPLVTRYEHLKGTDVNSWFEHKGIEGYVIHFPESKVRIKVKTNEYVALRYLKEITTEKLVTSLYNSQMFNLYLELDEELYPLLEALKRDQRVFLDLEVSKIPADVTTNRTEIAESKTLNKIQKAWLLGHQTPEYIEGMMDRKGFRKSFKERGQFPETDAAIKKMFSDKVALLGATLEV